MCKKVVTSLLIMLLTVSFVFAAGQQEAAENSGPQKVRMSSWLATEGASRDTLLEMLDMYKAGHPGVEIELINIPYAQTQQQIIVSTTAGNAPDIMQLNPMFSLPLANMNALKDLSAYYQKDELNDIPTAALEAGYFDGQLLTVPWQIAPIAVLANKELLKQAGLKEEIPGTWPELLAAVDKISALGDDVYGFGARTAKGSNTAFWFLPVLWGMGGEFDVNGEVRLNSPEAVQAFDWYRKLGMNREVPVGTSIPETRNLFAQNKVGFLFDGPWMKGIMRNSTGQGEAADDSYVIGPYPVGMDGKRHGIGNNHVLAVSGKSKVADTAADIIRTLTMDKDITSLYYKNMGAIPVYRSLLADPMYSDDPFVEVFIESSEFAVCLPSQNPNLNTALEEVATGLQEVMLGAESAPVVEKLDKSIKEIFSN